MDGTLNLGCRMISVCTFKNHSGIKYCYSFSFAHNLTVFVQRKIHLPIHFAHQQTIRSCAYQAKVTAFQRLSYYLQQTIAVDPAGLSDVIKASWKANSLVIICPCCITLFCLLQWCQFNLITMSGYTSRPLRCMSLSLLLAIDFNVVGSRVGAEWTKSQRTW